MIRSENGEVEIRGLNTKVGAELKELLKGFFDCGFAVEDITKIIARAIIESTGNKEDSKNETD